MSRKCLIANSIPKSGTHLLMKLLYLTNYIKNDHQLSSSLVSSATKNPIFKLLNFIRRARTRNHSSLVNLDIDGTRHQITSHDFKRIIEKYYGCTGARFFDAHLPFSDLLESIMMDIDCKMIFLIRDPRDIAVSYANHMTGELSYPLGGEYKIIYDIFNKNTDFNEKLRLIKDGITINGIILLAPVRQRIENQIGWIMSSLVKTVKFEDLIGSRGGGSYYRQAQCVSEIYDYLSIEYNSKKIKEVSSSLFDNTARTFNKGTIGQWKVVMRKDMQDEYNHILGPLLEKMGYEVW